MRVYMVFLKRAEGGRELYFTTTADRVGPDFKWGFWNRADYELLCLDVNPETQQATVVPLSEL